MNRKKNNLIEMWKFLMNPKLQVKVFFKKKLI